jgi:biotin synthase
MNRRQILEHLLVGPKRSSDLFLLADKTCRNTVGDLVHLRGLIEFSNRCQRQCLYCGMRAANTGLERYQLTLDQIIACAAKAHQKGYGTVVLQSGEDHSVSTEWLCSIVSTIKNKFDLAVSMCVGERPIEDYRRFREHGADGYLLRFETSDPDLYSHVHPARRYGLPGRMELISNLQKLGFDVGGGVMVGIPGQSYASLADDILCFAEMDLDMIGIGCYIPHPETPLALEQPVINDQVPNTFFQTLKVLSLARIVCPEANIPASTALATVSTDGYSLGLQCGANVIMPNITPLKYKRLYDIYPTGLERGQPTTKSLSKIIDDCNKRRGKGPGKRTRAHGLKIPRPKIKRTSD